VTTAKQICALLRVTKDAACRKRAKKRGAGWAHQQRTGRNILCQTPASLASYPLLSIIDLARMKHLSASRATYDARLPRLVLLAAINSIMDMHLFLHAALA